VEGTTIRLSFDATGLGFSAGCNSFYGAYSLCDGKLCASDLAGTEIGCDAPLHAQDEWLRAFMASTPTLTHAGARVTLEGTEATLEFLDRELANPDRSLTGRTWAIDTLIDGGAASTVPAQTTPTLVFQDDGVFQSFSTCASGSGTYSMANGELTVSELNFDERECPPTGNLLVQDRILQVLGGAGNVDVEIDAARLTLMRGTVGLSATTD
jgi:heat shock protein HslJ